MSWNLLSITHSLTHSLTQSVNKPTSHQPINQPIKSINQKRIRVIWCHMVWNRMVWQLLTAYQCITYLPPQRSILSTCFASPHSSRTCSSSVADSEWDHSSVSTAEYHSQYVHCTKLMFSMCRLLPTWDPNDKTLVRYSPTWDQILSQQWTHTLCQLHLLNFHCHKRTPTDSCRIPAQQIIYTSYFIPSRIN